MQTGSNERTDLLAIIIRRPSACASCSGALASGDFITMDDAGPLCLDCADLGHLEYLPSGNTALTRRSKKNSTLSAVVVQWSRTRRRYERQGLLAEPEAIAAAERECLADSEVRRRRRERDEELRAVADEKFIGSLATAISEQFPHCPKARVEQIARRTGTRGSGRVGRTGAGRALDPSAVRAAVVASVRHQDTDYDELLMRGVSRDEARRRVQDAIDEVLVRWSY